jgi:hypothetical protein
MDKIYILKKLKKYLFFISIVFLWLTGTHIIYNYIYHDSKEVAQKWWTISESFIGSFPNLNPLKYNNNYNSYINHILYRSLLTYNIQEGKIVGDLAKCDILDLSKIECFLDDNIKWSNWNNIEADDIISTYNILKQTNVNIILKNTLEKVTITKKKSSIVFETKENDVNILNLFFQPILPKDIIEQINIDNINWNFSPINWVYSWKYKISKIDQDETVWFTKIFLEKNEFYSRNPVYIDNIILKFYKDHTALLQQKDNINVFGDKNHLIWNSIPKIQKHNYILPQYVGVFINKDKLEYPNIRNYILGQIDSEKVLKEVWEVNNKLINSPFLNNLNINTFNDKSSFKSMMNSLWYYKKDFYLWVLTKKESRNISDEVSIVNNTKQEESISSKNTDIVNLENSITKENYNSESKIIVKPEWVDSYNFITNSNITLEWKTNKNVSEIYINDYKLNNYNPKDENFYLKLSETIGNIKVWENNYEIYFKENWRKSLKETITLIYSKKAATLEEAELDLIIRLNNEKRKREEEREKERILAEIKKTEERSNRNNNIVSKEDIKKQNLISKLDDRFYYNENFEVYSLNLVYTEWSEEISLASNLIAEELEKSWIKINTFSERLVNITKQISSWEENYNILIAWINLWYFNFNISKYFYSGQINKWKNLSKIQNSDLDNILEELKSSLLSKNKRLELQESIIKILEKEAVFKPLYSPYYSNLVVKNIEWYELNEVIPSDIYRFEPLSKSYILKNKIINNINKNTVWFIKFLITNMF